MERGCRLELFMRECFERNGSAQNGSKRSCKREAYPYLRGTVPYRTVPKSRVNAALGLPLIIKIRSTDNYLLYCIMHPGVAPGIFGRGGRLFRRGG